METNPEPTGLMQKDNATIDPQRLDRLDYFIAALKRHGVYVDINLHVGRMYPGFEKWEGMSGYFKGVDNFVPGMIESQKQFARDLLTHVNPYTRTAYTDEPCVAFVEINNENALFSEWYGGKIDKLPPVYLKELENQWNAWLSAKYPVVKSMNSLVAVPKKNGADKGTDEQQRDWIAFLYSVEEKYWVGMYRFLKDDLHDRSVVVGTPQGWSPFPIQAQLDAIDCHGYWQHPNFPHKPWDPADWTVKNKPMVSDPNGGLLGSLGRVHVAGKPFICTEYMEAAPNTYNSETMPLLAAYAALQDWDAVFLFAYSHNLETMKAGYYRNFFDIAPHPTKLATLPAAVAMFTRGDVAAGQPQIVLIPRKEIVDLTRQHGPTFRATDYGATQQDALRHPVEMALSDDAPSPKPAATPSPAEAVASDTGQLRWAWPPTGGMVTVDTPRSAGVIGFAPAESRVALGQVAITPHASALGFATIQATVMDGADFRTARRVLVTATGTASNTDLQWKTPEKDSVGTDWGRAPSLAEGISATIELPLLIGAQAWALDARGQRTQPVELTTKDGHTVLEIGPRWKTLWYEIEAPAAPAASLPVGLERLRLNLSPPA